MQQALGVCVSCVSVNNWPLGSALERRCLTEETARQQLQKAEKASQCDSTNVADATATLLQQLPVFRKWWLGCFGTGCCRALVVNLRLHLQCSCLQRTCQVGAGGATFQHWVCARFCVFFGRYTTAWSRALAEISERSQGQDRTPRGNRSKQGLHSSEFRGAQA